MMQTHKSTSIKMIIVTALTLIGLFLLQAYSFASDICLALFGSAIIASFLEIMNYIEAKRQLILQQIADNNILSNYISDFVWFYRTTVDSEKKLNEFIALYEKTQNYIFTLSKEVYCPFWPKGHVFNTIKENANAMVEVLDILLKGQRTIVSFRLSREQLKYEEKDRVEIENLLEKQISELIDAYIAPLKSNESILLDCNKEYMKKYKLMDISSVKKQDEVMEEIISSIENRTNEESKA